MTLRQSMSDWIMRNLKPHISHPLLTKRNIMNAIGAIIIVAFIGMCIYSITDGNRKVHLRDIQIKTMGSEKQQLESDLNRLNVQFEELKMDSHATEQEKLKLQQEIDAKNKELQEKDKALQAKAEAKRLEEEKLAEAAKLRTATAHAAASGDNVTYTWNFLRGQGFTREQTAGIMGNLQQEHGFQTSDVGGGLGIAQWLGGRRANLMARDNYLNIGVQLQFLVDEMNGPESAAGNAVKSSTSVEGATVAFQNKFERCGMCHEYKRIQYAYGFYNRY